MKEKRKFKVLVVVIIGIVLLLIPITLMAKEKKQVYSTINKYVAIGDSISLDNRAESNVSYVSLIDEFLSSINPNINYENLSQSGATSQDLLQIINSNTEKISDADLITISIGGNNILEPILELLNNIINEDKISLNDYDKEKIYKEINEKLNSDEGKKAIADGIYNFKGEFPKAIAKVKELSPNAQIYVVTIYNPINEENDIKNFLDEQISLINEIIYDKSNKYDYDIIDTFKLLQGNEYCSFDLDMQNFDIHPNNIGHAVIASEVIDDYGDYVALNVNMVTNTSQSITGTTVPDTNIIIMSDNKPIAMAKTNSSGKFEAEISPLKPGTDIHVLVYDKNIFSILYKFERLVVKKGKFTW